MKPRPYFSLLTRDDGPWSVQFGDFERGVVAAEFDEYIDQGYKARDLKIINTDSSQTAIDAAVAKLNN